jgi:hypothetical protein
MADNASENDIDLQPALDAAQNQLGLTISASDSLNSTSLAILAADVALAIFALQSEMHNQWWLLVPLFISLLFSVYLTLKIIWPGKSGEYAGAIVDITEHQSYLTLPTDELVLQLLVDTQAAINYNNEQNAVKTRNCIAAIILSLIGVGFLIGCII